MDLFSKKNRILLKELIKTDFKLRYQGSVIGYLWSILKPLMMFAIMYVVFVRFLPLGAGVPHWPVALLVGNVVWSFFSDQYGDGLYRDTGRLAAETQFFQAHHRLVRHLWRYD